MFKQCLSILVPSLVIASCGDNLYEAETTDTSVSDDVDRPSEPTDAPQFEANIVIETITCDATIARFEPDARYVDDNSPVPNIACKWTFDDGATSTDCAGEHEFASAGAHDFILEVTDLDTGATSVATQTRIFAPPLALTLDVSANDLSISYSATSNTGGEQVVFVSPDSLVVADDPNYPRVTNGTVRVLEPGSYTITYRVEDERGASEICVGEIVKTITTVCSGGGHVH